MFDSIPLTLAAEAKVFVINRPFDLDTASSRLESSIARYSATIDDCLMNSFLHEQFFTPFSPVLHPLPVHCDHQELRSPLIWMRTLMQPAKYILWQGDNEWRGYLEGYAEYEIQGESFEEL